MKTLKFISTAFLLMICAVSFSQTKQAEDKTENKSMYLVQAKHTPEQCLDALTEFKDKGNGLLAKFEFGCMSGDHTGYAFLEGKSESGVRQTLPKEIQSIAKIQKVDKFTNEQIEKIHQDKMNK